MHFLNFMPCIVVHAEYNAILAKGAPSLKGCTLYVTKYPCHGCAQVIVQAGISKVIFAEDDTSSNPKTHNSYLASKTIFRETNQHATGEQKDLYVKISRTQIVILSIICKVIIWGYS
jgi:deoxycytidylate deaminase